MHPLHVPTALVLLAAAASAQWEGAVTPPWQGQIGTEFSGWDHFLFPLLTPNLPDDPATSSDDAVLVQTEQGALITGTGNLYNPDGPSHFEVSDSVPSDLAEVLLQTRTVAFGNPVDTGSVVLSYDSGGTRVTLPPDATTSLGGTSGDEWLFSWDLGAVADEIEAYTIAFDASDAHCSLDAVRLDTRTDAGSLAADVGTISLLAGGVQTLALDAGPGHAGETYLLLGSLTGTSPGLPIDGHLLPLVVDSYTLYSLSAANGPVLGNSFSNLDAFGRATATVSVPAGATPSFAGVHIDHAYVVWDVLGDTFQAEFTSQPEGLDLVP